MTTHIYRTAACCFGILHQLRSVQSSLPRCLLCCSSPVLCWQSLITVTCFWSAFPQSSWTDSRPSLTQQLVWSVILWRQVTLNLCWKTYSTLATNPGKEPVQAVFYPGCVLAFKYQHSLAPPYMFDQLQQVARVEPRQHLRSWSSPALVVPPTRMSSLGDRAFLVAAARAWNSLPSTVTPASTLHSFHRALKTYLFTASFPPASFPPSQLQSVDFTLP